MTKYPSPHLSLFGAIENFFFFYFGFPGLFYTNITSERNCEVRLKLAKLDHETTEEYQLNIKLDTLSGLVNPQKSLTTLKIHVTDVNDNKPEFVFPPLKYKNPPNSNVYYAAIPKDSQFGTNVLTVKVSSFRICPRECARISESEVT